MNNLFTSTKAWGVNTNDGDYNGRVTDPSTPRRYQIPPPTRGGGSLTVTHAHIVAATAADLDGMAAQLMAEATDGDGMERLYDLSMGCIALQRWRVGLRVAYEVRERGAVMFDRRLRWWALREVLHWSPLLNPQLPWPPPEVPAELHSQLDVAGLIVFALEGGPEVWRDHPALACVADEVVAAINRPWRLVR